MKLIILSWAIVIIGAIKQEIFQPAPDKLQAVIDKFAKPCVKNGADVKVLVAQLPGGDLPRDDETNEFLYCFTKNAGYIYDDGHVIVDGIAGILGQNHHLKEQMKEALRKCNEITKEDRIQTVVAMNTCIAETAPVLFVFTL